MGGQRRSRDREKTVSEILDGAKRLFAKHGLQGTSLRMLEEETGVSKGLILYHFSTKEELFDAVLLALSEDYAAHLKGLIRPDVSYPALVEATVGESLRYQHEHPGYRRMQLWAHLEGRDRLPEINLKLTHRLIEALSQAQAAGQGGANVSPLYAPFIIRGAIEYWVENKPLIEAILAEYGLSYEEAENEFIQQLSALMK
jgi:AcrR family transcriptional regulator